MGPLALLATPGGAALAGSAVSGLFGLLSGRSQAKATRESSRIQAQAARDAGRRQQASVDAQMKLAREMGERDEDMHYAAQEANWEMERARERRRFGETGDERLAQFALARQMGRMGYGERAADRLNTREELLAGLRTDQARRALRQERVGWLGEMLGAPTPAGGRRIAALREPGALRQPEWVPLPDPRQTAFEYPEYAQPVRRPWGDAPLTSADVAQRLGGRVQPGVPSLDPALDRASFVA